MSTAAITKSKTPPSDRDSWATPHHVVENVEEFLGFRFGHDVCASAQNYKAPRWWSEKEDALSIDWAAALSAWHDRGPLAVWMNPPYSNPLPWVMKAAEESRKGLIVVGLLPDDRSTKWYQAGIEGHASLALVPNRRISFLDANGKPINGNPKGSVLPIWTPWRTGRTEYVRIEL